MDLFLSGMSSSFYSTVIIILTCLGVLYKFLSVFIKVFCASRRIANIARLSHMTRTLTSVFRHVYIGLFQTVLFLSSFPCITKEQTPSLFQDQTAHICMSIIGLFQCLHLCASVSSKSSVFQGQAVHVYAWIWVHVVHHRRRRSIPGPTMTGFFMYGSPLHYKYRQHQTAGDTPLYQRV